VNKFYFGVGGTGGGGGGGGEVCCVVVGKRCLGPKKKSGGGGGAGGGGGGGGGVGGGGGGWGYRGWGGGLGWVVWGFREALKIRYLTVHCGVTGTQKMDKAVPSQFGVCDRLGKNRVSLGMLARNLYIEMRT